MLPHYINHVLKPLHFPLFLSKLKDRVYTKIEELEASYARTKEPVLYKDRLALPYKKIEKGQKWGEEVFDCAWFNFKGSIPLSAKGEKIVLLIDISGEGLLFDEKGNPVRGITNGSSVFDRELGEPCKRVIPWLEKSVGNEVVDIWVDGANNDLFGNLSVGGFIQADIASCDDTIRKLYYDCLFLYDLVKCTEEKSARHYALLNALNDIMRTVSVDFKREEVLLALEITARELQKKNGDVDLAFTAVGHGHLDLAWLWPIRESRRKAVRTIATQLKNIEKYPDFIYNISQPQQLEWIKEDYPTIYKQVVERIGEGRIELEGGTFVECDTYMPSGESLIRQFLIGKKFIKNEFGLQPEVLWLPDTFGYSAAIPQIMTKCGMKYFITIKLSWSAINAFPYHTFHWKGVDGTTVLAHMPPGGTYNDSAMPRANKKAEQCYIDKGICDQAMLLYGIGDGGGGPSPKHIELMARQKNACGLCPTTQGKTSEFFKSIQKNSSKYHTYNGELYVQNHQGTLTSVAMVKYYNRLLERKLKQAEYICGAAKMIANNEYPHNELEKIWKVVLLNQFHDILPGSSIKRVYDESKVDYEKALIQVEAIISNAEMALSIGEGQGVYNTSSFENTGEVVLCGKETVVRVKPFSSIFEIENKKYNIKCTNTQMENDMLKVEFDENGHIISLINKRKNFEYIEKGSKANVLNMYNDMGDAWDMSIDYMHQQKERFVLQNTETRLEKNRIVRQDEYTYKNSTLHQTLILAGYNEYLECRTEVDFNEKDKMLRADFPVNISCKEVKCDMQFGSYSRSVGDNTSWEYARFEMCAHKFVDISCGNVGFAILNDSKYGHHVSDKFVSLNLIRCKEYPNEYFDLGKHTFSYAIYPHEVYSCGADVEKQAYNFNNKLVNTKMDIKSCFIASSDSSAVIIENIKVSEDSNGYIVRLYENTSSYIGMNMNFGINIKAAYECDMLEENRKALPLNKNVLALQFSPREIKTIYIEKKL